MRRQSHRQHRGFESQKQRYRDEDHPRRRPHRHADSPQRKEASGANPDEPRIGHRDERHRETTIGDWPGDGDQRAAREIQRDMADRACRRGTEQGGETRAPVEQPDDARRTARHHHGAEQRVGAELMNARR